MQLDTHMDDVAELYVHMLLSNLCFVSVRLMAEDNVTRQTTLPNLTACLLHNQSTPITRDQTIDTLTHVAT